MGPTKIDPRAFAGVSMRLDTDTERRLDRLARKRRSKRGQIAKEAFLAGLAILEEGAKS